MPRPISAKDFGQENFSVKQKEFGATQSRAKGEDFSPVLALRPSQSGGAVAKW
jgi:hypothetical protein